MKFASIITKLDILSGASKSHSESWSHLDFAGEYNSRLSKNFFGELYDMFSFCGIESAIGFQIDGEKVDKSEFTEELYDGGVWGVHINKLVWLDLLDENDIAHTFFYDINSFVNWIKNSSPFDEDYPLNKHHFHIIVNGLQNSFGGPNFIVNNSDSINKNQIKNYFFPTSNIIETSIRITCNSEYIIAPLKHIVTNGCVDNVSQFFFRNAIKVLLASIGNEITKEKKIAIKGYRCIVEEIGGDTFDINILYNYHQNLLDVVKWIYESEETCTLKKKLFVERISLDLVTRTSLFDGLYPILLDASSQAKEQYSYVIYDRKDDYQKELKEILKDIKNVTDLLSLKIRNILGNLLRDVLAALILIGITLFSKVQEIENLSENQLICYVFRAFGIYFVGSVILQSIFDYIDIKRSIKELDYWKNVTRSYITSARFDEYKKQTIGKRFKNMIPFYLVIVLLYIVISIGCFNYLSVMETVLPPFSDENKEPLELYDKQKQDIINANIEYSNDTII